MRVGFTGTQKGMTLEQKAELEHILLGCLLEVIFGSSFHHGDCVGADAEASDIARNLEYRIICHPPLESSKRAFTASDFEFPKKSYLDRNRDIVNACEILIAAPKENKEVLRSGTWATIRYARKNKVPVIIIAPKG